MPSPRHDAPTFSLPLAPLRHTDGRLFLIDAIIATFTDLFHIFFSD